MGNYLLTPPSELIGNFLDDIGFVYDKDSREQKKKKEEKRPEPITDPEEFDDKDLEDLKKKDPRITDNITLEKKISLVQGVRKWMFDYLKTYRLFSFSPNDSKYYNEKGDRVFGDEIDDLRNRLGLKIIDKTLTDLISLRQNDKDEGYDIKPSILDALSMLRDFMVKHLVIKGELIELRDGETMNYSDGKPQALVTLDNYIKFINNRY